MLYKRILSIVIPVIMCPIISFADYQAIVNVDALNIRVGKESSSAIVGEVLANTRLDVTREGNRWLKTKIKNKEGYLFQDYVDLYEVKEFGKVTFRQNFSMKDVGMHFYKGEVAPAYDYFNEYYLVKKDYRYFYIHKSVVDFDKKSVFSKPMLIKQGAPTKLKAIRLKNNQMVTKNKENSENLVSLLEVAEVATQKKSTEVKNAPKEVNDSDLFDGFELDIESVENDSKVKQKTNNKKDETLDKNNSSTDKLKYEKFISRSGLDKFVDRSDVLSFAVEELGKPYVYGANGPTNFDCSGFTSYVFKKSGISIPRTSYLQAEKGDSIARNDLKSGDLVFFDTRRLNKVTVEVEDENASPVEEFLDTVELRDIEPREMKKKKYVIKPSKVTHVGIYIGDGKFIHASSGQKKVVINELGSKYYSERYYGAKRYR